MSWLVWAIPLAVIVFLWNVNEFLRGTLKQMISGVLALFIFAFCGVAFWVSGWIMGLVALGSAFILGALLRAPALFVAKKLIKYPDLGADEFMQSQYQRMVHNFGTKEYFEEIEDEEKKDAHHMKLTINKASGKADVQEVLKKLSANKQDLEAFYQRIEIISLPPHLREVAICNPRMVEYFLQNSVKVEVAGKYDRNLTGFDVSLKLTLWAKQNPNGEMPN